MCFVAPPDMAASSLPDPMDPTVHKEDVPGGLFAATLLPGEPSRDRATQAAALLREALARDGVKVREDAGAPYQLAVYNGPGTPAELRRNEILVPVME